MRFIFAILFFGSGFAALGFQMVWSKLFASGLGHEIPSILATVSALFFGMAAGAFCTDRVIARTMRSCQLFALLECVVGVWGGASTFLIPTANQFALKLIGLDPSAFRHWLIAFMIPCVVLLPATFAMGATFPAMYKVVCAASTNRRVIGGIYAANTLGAVAGVLFTTFVILPGISLSNGLLVCASLNLVIAAVMLFLPGRQGAVCETDRPGKGVDRKCALKLFALGLLGIGFELWGTRMLSQVLENTIYTYATILAVFLTGLTVGAASFQWFRRSIPANFATLALLLAASLLCFSFTMVFAENEYASLRRMSGDSRFAVMLSELLTSATLFAVPSFLMGLIYSELMQRVADAGGPLGKASAINTLGSALAAPVWVVFLLPAVGSKWVLILIIAGYLLLAQLRMIATFVVGASIIGFALLLPSNYSLFRESTAASVWLNEGVMATVAVRRDEAGRRSLFVNHRFQMGGTGSTAAEQRHADIPLLLHGHAKRALFLGLGTGISMGAARFHEGLRVDGVELLPGVIKSLPRFAPENGDPQTLPNFRIYTADARRFVRCATNQYDVIVADLFNPAHDGIGLLYSEEHFRAVKQRLHKGGLFCQWLPLYQMDSQTLRSIIVTFLHVYEHSDAFLLRFNVDTPVLGLIGAESELNFASGYSPMAEKLSEHLREIGLADSLRLLGGYLGGTKELKGYAGDARINTDAFPHLIFDAPVFSYNRYAPSYVTLTNLLSEIPVSLPILEHQSAAGFTESLKRFMTARNRYLEGLVRESEGRGSEAIDLYIEASKLSADFTQGYARCISIVSSLQSTEHQNAVDLLKRLIQAQPDRILGKELLDRLTSPLPKP